MQSNHHPADPSTTITPRHPTLLIALHWATVLAILGAFALVLGRELVDEKALRGLLMTGHRSLGLVVLAATLVRLAVRRKRAAGAVPGDLQQRLAGATHLALYVLLAALPLLGWALSSARGHAVSLFGLLPLPSLLERNADLADQLADAHGWLAWTLAALVALHAAAALWHHFVRKDGVLRAMLPALPSGRRAGAQPHPSVLPNPLPVFLIDSPEAQP